MPFPRISAKAFAYQELVSGAMMDIPFVRIFATLCCGLWFVALVVNFVIILKNEHMLLTEKLLEDEWLLVQCEDPVFAARLHLYNDPCSHARHRTHMNIYIIAFHRTLDQVFLCGSYSCEGLVWMLLEKVRSNLVLFFCVLIVLLVLVPIVLFPLWRRWTEQVGEAHIRDKFNMPYGFNPALVHGGHDYGNNHLYSPHMYATPAHMSQLTGRSFPQQRTIGYSSSMPAS
jgi:hypothetical protein